MPLFRRRKATQTAPLSDPELVDRITPAPLQAKAGLLRFLPIGDIIKGITGVLRDPNGKISSKRAGAGALVTAGIYFLDSDRMAPGVVCLGFALALFFLTKWDAQPPE
jgi:hypothetical protein